MRTAFDQKRDSEDEQKTKSSAFVREFSVTLRNSMHACRYINIYIYIYIYINIYIYIYIYKSGHLHVGADAEQQAEVHAEGANVRAGLAFHPEHAQVACVVVLQQLRLRESTAGEQRRRDEMTDRMRMANNRDKERSCKEGEEEKKKCRQIYYQTPVVGLMYQRAVSEKCQESSSLCSSYETLPTQSQPISMDGLQAEGLTEEVQSH
jgi:hypothetical protein